MEHTLQIKKRVWHFFVAFFLLTHFTQCAGENLPFFLKLPQNPDDVSFILKELYLPSFVPKKAEEEEEKKEEKKDRNILEGKKVVLDNRTISKEFFSRIARSKNSAFSNFFERKKAHLVDMRPITCDSWNLFAGSINNRSHSGLNQIMPEGTQIGKCCMAIRMLLPIDNMEQLQRDQTIVKKMVEDVDFYEKSKKVFKNIERAEASIISLFTKEKDPLFSENYQKELKIKFTPSPSPTEKKYKKKGWVEFQRRLKIEMAIFFNFFVQIFVAYLSIHAQIKELEDSEIQMHNDKAKHLKNLLKQKGFLKLYFEGLKKSKVNLFVQILAWAIAAYQIWQEMRLTLSIGKYISSRLNDAKEVLHAARKIDQWIKNNPELNDALGNKLDYTRKILNKQHENKGYNQLAKVLLAPKLKYDTFHDLFFKSFADKLIALTLLEDHIEMLDGVLFELGMIESYLAAATLIKNDAGNKNGFAFAQFMERDKVYLQLDGVWNVLIDPNKAIPNTFVLDGEKANAVGVTGPNAAGKSVITTSIVQAPYWAQVLGGIVPCNSKEGVPMTIVSAFFVFKEAGDDPNRNKSLFAAELEVGFTGLKIFKKTEAEGKIALGQFDEFFGGTNIIERVAAQESYAKEVIKNFKKSGFFFITHNIFLLKHLPRLTQVHIERYQDGGYRNLYTLSEGRSKEMVGIDLFEKELKEFNDLREFKDSMVKNAREKSAAIKKEFEELAKKQ